MEDIKFGIVLKHHSLPPQAERELEGEAFTNYKRQQNR